MKIVAAALAILAIGAVSGAAFVYSGWYNVAASEPHTALMNKLLRTISKNSIWHPHDRHAAWGQTHSEEDLWAIVAFLRELPELEAHDYQQLADVLTSNDLARTSGRLSNPLGARRSLTIGHERNTRVCYDAAP